MEILMIIVIAMTLLNMLFVIGIAGSLAKLIKYVSIEEQMVGRAKWANIIRGRRTQQMQEGNSPSYADTLAMSPIPEDINDGPRGWDGIARSNRNWDGLPAIEDK